MGYWCRPRSSAEGEARSGSVARAAPRQSPQMSGKLCRLLRRSTQHLLEVYSQESRILRGDRPVPRGKCDRRSLQLGRGILLAGVPCQSGENPASTFKSNRNSRSGTVNCAAPQWRQITNSGHTHTVGSRRFLNPGRRIEISPLNLRGLFEPHDGQGIKAIPDFRRPLGT